MDCAYIATSATVAGVAMPGMVGFDYNEGASVINNRSANEVRSKKTCLTDVQESITVRGIDPNVVGLRVGVTGITTLTYKKNVGSLTLGATAGTIVAALTTILSVTPGNDMDGNSSLTVTLKIDSADGQASGVVWTAAAA